jgi:RimJ/RimL family protein N-acetyltransferase
MIDYGKVRLSPYVKSLRQKLFDWMNDGPTRRAAGEYRPFSEPEFDAWLAGMTAGREQMLFIIAEQESMTPAGFCTLTGVSPVHRRGRLGIAVDSGMRRRGLGGDAVAGLTRHAFFDLGLERLALDAPAGNEAALRLYERCGFRREGVWRRHFFIDGAFHDAVAMAILRDEVRPPPAGAVSDERL